MYELLIFAAFIIILIITFWSQTVLFRSRYKYGWLKIFIPTITLVFLQKYLEYKAETVGWMEGIGYTFYSIVVGIACLASILYGCWLKFKQSKT